MDAAHATFGTKMIVRNRQRTDQCGREQPERGVRSTVLDSMTTQARCPRTRIFR